MRTTLRIDDDVLVAAKAIAAQRGKTVGNVISDLVRRSLVQPLPAAERNGIGLLKPADGSAGVTLDMVNAMRDDLA